MTRAIASVDDLRMLARRKLPRMMFDFVDGGSYSETTMRRNNVDLEAIHLRQKVMVDVSRRSAKTTMLGQVSTMPLAIAPTGLSGFLHRNGEIHGARAAEAFGVPFCLSTVSICSIEDVRAAVKEPFWFQLYVLRDRGVSKALLEKALAADCSALLLTVDTQVSGRRRRDLRNGLSVPPRLSAANLIDMALHPAWAWGLMTGRRRSFGNLDGLVQNLDISSLSQWVGTQFETSLTWRDLEWVRELWPQKLVLKGIMTEEDAREAAAIGADGIVVSNHGGRQLDGARSSISALPAIAGAVGDRLEVLFDGGVRSGQDVLRALALGARGCLAGRAYLYGLAAMGEAGVTAMLETVRAELDTSMALCGVTDLTQIADHVLDLEAGPFA